MIEVELKAHVRDRARVLEAVSSFAQAEGEVDKSDDYWHGPDWRLHRGSRGFRIRSEAAGGEGQSTVITFKQKRSESGVEINRESEFEVSDREAFVEFALRLGCESFYSKRKRGWKFRAALADPKGAAARAFATVEIIEVVGLGDFIEIEILLPDEDPQAIALARGEIRAILARAGVGEDEIESRFYSELLTAAGLVQPSL